MAFNRKDDWQAEFVASACGRPQVALCWHGWNLNSVVLDALTHALQSAAALALLPPEPQTKPISNKIV